MPSNSRTTDTGQSRPQVRKTEVTNADQMRASGTGRRKVPLPPGRSQLDWIRNSKIFQTRRPRAVSAEEVALHKSRNEAWIVIRDKVYDVTPYIEYHPGGVNMIMSGAGRVRNFTPIVVFRI